MFAILPKMKNQNIALCFLFIALASPVLMYVAGQKYDDLPTSPQIGISWQSTSPSYVGTASPVSPSAPPDIAQ